MARIRLIGGEKGGVGKSVVARLLAQYFIDRDSAWVAFDSDRSHGALLRYYSGFAVPIDVTRMQDLDRIVESLDQGIDEVVVDLAAQTEPSLWEWIESGEVLSLLAELGHSLWFWYVMDDGKDSVQLLAAHLDRIGSAGQVVCVLNHGRGQNFELFEESKLRNRIEQRGGHVIDLPRLHAESMRKVDAYDKSFWAALHNTDPEEGPCLSLMQRHRARVFLRRAHASFDELLGTP